MTSLLKQREKHRLEAIHASGLLDSPPNPEVDALTADLAEHYRTKYATVALYLSDKEIHISAYGGEEEEQEEAEEYMYPTGYKLMEDTDLFGRHLPVIVADCREHPKYSTLPYVVSGITVFMVFSQLYTKDGVVIGTVTIDDPDPRYDFTLKDADYLVNVDREIQSIYGI